MIVKPHKYMLDAFHNQYTLGAFNTSNLELTQAIIGAAAKENSPVIVETSESAIEYAGLDVITNLIKNVSDEFDVPVIVHLDHGKSLATARQCVDAGYTSVMIDASKSTFEENVKLTCQVVEMAHRRGVWVEAELGSILGDEGARGLDGGKTPDHFLTDPAKTKEFANRTKVDALAVSVGTIHGAFTGQEYIRFELLEEIMAAVPNLPLVLHGASGITAEHLKKAAATNVSKVNVDTEMRIAFDKAVKAYFDINHNKLDPRDILGPAREAVEEVVRDKIKTLGSSGKIKLS